MNLWTPVSKGDDACRALADRHYTRGKPGHPQWNRPGYNYVLRGPSAVFVWWRPKWEAGQERFDGLRVLECTIFRNEGGHLSSALVAMAVEALTWPEASAALMMDRPARLALVTGVSSAKTARRRSKHKAPGVCFREAGFVDFAHKKGRADVWLRRDV